MAPETPPSDADAPPERSYWRGFGLGMLTWLAATALYGGALFAAAATLAGAGGIWDTLPAAGLVLHGVGQLVYVVPLAAFHLARGRTAEAAGVLFAAGLAFSFNALCWGGVALVIASDGGRLAG